jgi:hypothetical protein
MIIIIIIITKWCDIRCESKSTRWTYPSQLDEHIACAGKTRPSPFSLPFNTSLPFTTRHLTTIVTSVMDPPYIRKGQRSPLSNQHSMCIRVGLHRIWHNTLFNSFNIYWIGFIIKLVLSLSNLNRTNSVINGLGWVEFASCS